MSAAPTVAAVATAATATGPGRVELGQSGIRVPPVAIGAEALGGYEWGDLDVSKVDSAVLHALDRGLTFIDMADCYGKGEAERRLGRVLGGRRHEAVIASKFGVCFDAAGRTCYDNAPSYIPVALEGSLRRLGTDYIDLYQLHWPDGKTPLADVFGVLERLQDAGKIRSYGVANTSLAAIRAAGSPPRLATFSFERSLASRHQEPEIAEALRQLGASFLAWSPLGQGILTGKYDATTRFAADDRRSQPRWQNFHGEKLRRNLAIVAELRAVAAELGGVAPGTVAVRWIIDSMPRSLPLVGVKTTLQVDELAAVCDLRLPDWALARLDDISRLRPDGQAASD